MTIRLPSSVAKQSHMNTFNHTHVYVGHLVVVVQSIHLKFDPFRSDTKSLQFSLVSMPGKCKYITVSHWINV